MRYKQSNKEKSEEIYYKSLESFQVQDIPAFLRLLDESLQLDPGNIHALLMKADLETVDESNYIQRLKKILSLAESQLGSKFFKENKGYFWGILETRPYMSILSSLVESLVHAKRLPEAISYCETMLELNPNDNQGMRDVLIGLYLEIGALDQADKLINQYEDDYSATFTWGRVLERFISNDLPGAEKALDTAFTENPYFKDYVIGKKTPPKERPPYYSPGSIEEAVLCFDLMGRAWLKNPKAIQWLKSKNLKTPKPKHSPKLPSGLL